MDIVIGAGISGLSYALFTNNPITVIEKESEIGGYCRTIKRNGYIWDYSGHFFHFQDDVIKNIVIRNIADNALREVQKSTKIYYDGLYVDFPFQKNIHQLPKNEFIECLHDLFIKERDGVSATSFKEMLYSEFGESISNKFLVPYNEKLYACDLNSLDINAMGRFFPHADKLDIIRNFKIQHNASYNGSFVYPESGAIEYINSIAAGIKSDNIRLNSIVDSIDIDKKYVRLSSGEFVKYDNLISTMPLPQLLSKCGIVHNSCMFSWNKVLVFNLGFNKKGYNTTDHWLYFPDKRVSFYRIGFYDNILKQDRLSLYVEIGFNNKDNISPNEWLGVVLKDLNRCGIIDESFCLVDYEAIIMNPAYVHISKKSEDAVRHFKAILEQHNIYSIGRYGSWTYCSIEDNIKEAKLLAESLNGKGFDYSSTRI